MIRKCEHCEAATRRPLFCSDRCANAARQAKLRSRDREKAAQIERVTVRATVVIDDDWEPTSEIENCFKSEIARKWQMIAAKRRRHRPIPFIDRPDPGEDVDDSVSSDGSVRAAGPDDSSQVSDTVSVGLLEAIEENVRRANFTAPARQSTGDPSGCTELSHGR